MHVCIYVLCMYVYMYVCMYVCVSSNFETEKGAGKRFSKNCEEMDILTLRCA